MAPAAGFRAAQRQLSLALVVAAAAMVAAVEGYSLPVFVRYPTAQARFTLRGSGCGLNWTAGVEMVQTGSDEWSTTIEVSEADVGTILQVKALVDDQEWSLGPNTLVRIEETAEATLARAGGEVLVAPFFKSNAGRYFYMYNLYSSYFDNYRDLVIYVPPSYDENPYKRYEVLIMHDGQNLFNASTSFQGIAWNCQQTLDGLIMQESMSEIIVVGVDNTADRVNEYTYSYDPTEKFGGDGDHYLDFLEQTVLPLIMRSLRYSSAPQSFGILGSSLGGLISCYAGWTRPQSYAKVGCMSSSFWWNSEDFNNSVMVNSTGPQPAAGVHFYLDSGNGNSALRCTPDDEDDCLQTETVLKHFEQYGYTLNKNVFHYIAPNAQHSETYWGERFYKPMLALYGIPGKQ